MYLCNSNSWSLAWQIVSTQHMFIEQIYGNFILNICLKKIFYVIMHSLPLIRSYIIWEIWNCLTEVIPVIYLNKEQDLWSKCAFSFFKNLPSTISTEQNFTKDISNKEKLWDYAKETFPLNGIRRSLKLKFPFNKNNVTEDVVLKIH